MDWQCRDCGGQWLWAFRQKTDLARELSWYEFSGTRYDHLGPLIYLGSQRSEISRTATVNWPAMEIYMLPELLDGYQPQEIKEYVIPGWLPSEHVHFLNRAYAEMTLEERTSGHIYMLTTRPRRRRGSSESGQSVDSRVSRSTSSRSMSPPHTRALVPAGGSLLDSDEESAPGDLRPALEWGTPQSGEKSGTPARVPTPILRRQSSDTESERSDGARGSARLPLRIAAQPESPPRPAAAPTIQQGSPLTGSRRVREGAPDRPEGQESSGGSSDSPPNKQTRRHSPSAGEDQAAPAESVPISLRVHPSVDTDSRVQVHDPYGQLQPPPYPPYDAHEEQPASSEPQAEAEVRGDWLDEDDPRRLTLLDVAQRLRGLEGWSWKHQESFDSQAAWANEQVQYLTACMQQIASETKGSAELSQVCLTQLGQVAEQMREEWINELLNTQQIVGDRFGRELRLVSEQCHEVDAKAERLTAEIREGLTAVREANFPQGMDQLVVVLAQMRDEARTDRLRLEILEGEKSQLASEVHRLKEEAARGRQEAARERQEAAEVQLQTDIRMQCLEKKWKIPL